MDISNRGFEKASDKLTPEHLDRPVDEVVGEASPESVPETPVKTESEASEVIPESEEDKVPKSRFLTMSQRAIAAERALRTFEAERANAPEQIEAPADDATLKAHYVELFGDNDVTEKLYKAELSRLASMEEKAAERAYERLSNREKEAEELVSQRVASFDAAFEELALAEGKTDFSDDEQVAMLDIVEKYSPKDKDGKLLGDFLLPLDKAYEIYQLDAQTKTQPKKTERNAVAALQGARSEGTPSATNDADWQPGQDRRWWNKVK